MRVLFFSLLIVATDQFTKWLAVTRLRPLGSVTLIPDFFNLSYVENIGAAWGMLAGQRWMLIGFALLTVGFMFWKRGQLFVPFRCSTAIQSLLYGGILGNSIDRIVTGRVIDFLDFHWGTSHFPAFNIADSAICCGAFLYLAVQWFCKPRTTDDKGKVVS